MDHERTRDAATSPAVEVLGLRGSFGRERLLEVVAEAHEATGAIVQAFDPGAIYGRAHVEAAVQRALRAEREGREIARDPAVEIVCYAAGDTQISEALDRVGVPAQGEALVLVALGPAGPQALDRVVETMGFEVDEGVLEGDEHVLDRLGVSPQAREAVAPEDRGLLVIEKVALLDALK